MPTSRRSWARTGCACCATSSPRSGRPAALPRGPGWRRPLLGRFEPVDGRNAIEHAIERRDRARTGELRASREVGLGEVDPVLLVELERPEQEGVVCDEN